MQQISQILRYRKNGKFSGEEFRDDVLVPAIKKSLYNKDLVVIDLDGTYGYADSFLDEVFGKLSDFVTKDEMRNVWLISYDNPELYRKISAMILA